MHKTFTIIAYVGRTAGKKCGKTSEIFGPLPPVNLGKLEYREDLNATRCYILADATITAGLVDYENNPVISRGLLWNSSVNSSHSTLHANPMNELILQISPKLTYTMASLNTSETWSTRSQGLELPDFYAR